MSETVKRTLSEKFASFTLWAISAVGGYLVSEQWISGESLVEIQGVVGMVLGGGGISLLAIFSIIRGLAPTVAKKTLEQVGEEKVRDFFNTVDNVFDYVKRVEEKLDLVLSKFEELEQEKELIKTDLGL